MLNLGQVVYDTTNNRTLLFCGFEMFQNKETGRCSSESAFIDENGNFMEFSDDNRCPFEYTNFMKDNKPFSGSAIKELGVGGHFFGILDGTREEVKKAAIKAIQDMKKEIAEHGITKQTKSGLSGKEHTSVTIGEVYPEENNQGLAGLTVSIVPK